VLDLVHQDPVQFCVQVSVIDDVPPERPAARLGPQVVDGRVQPSNETLGDVG